MSAEDQGAEGQSAEDQGAEVQADALLCQRCTACGVPLTGYTDAVRLHAWRYLCLTCWRDPRTYWLRTYQHDD